jgi:multidrug efflux system outer membrane protein
VQLAQARVRQARAQRLVTASAAYPTVGSSGSYIHIDRNLGLFGFGTGPTGTAQPGSASSFSGKLDLYQVGLDASWERDPGPRPHNSAAGSPTKRDESRLRTQIDLFGGVRHAVEPADANVAASRENLRDVLVTLLAESAFQGII